MDPIIYNGEEFKDKFIARTYFTPSLKMRIEFLFCANTTVEHEVFTKEIMPPEKTICHVHIRSVWDQLVGWYRNKKGMGMIEIRDQSINA